MKREVIQAKISERGTAFALIGQMHAWHAGQNALQAPVQPHRNYHRVPFGKDVLEQHRVVHTQMLAIEHVVAIAAATCLDGQLCIWKKRHERADPLQISIAIRLSLQVAKDQVDLRCDSGGAP